MSPFSKGFTLIELLVSIAIMTVILSVIFFNQSSYTDSTSLTNLADNISLDLRQAQQYGIAVKELSPGSADFSVGYGFTASLLASGSNSTYLLFVDKNANSIYDGNWTCVIGGANECFEKTVFARGDYIDSICAITSGGLDNCATAKRVDVSFRRPNPEAVITLFDGSAVSYVPAGFRGVKLNLKSPRGLLRSVSVYSTGQITVQ